MFKKFYNNGSKLVVIYKKRDNTDRWVLEFIKHDSFKIFGYIYMYSYCMIRQNLFEINLC